MEILNRDDKSKMIYKLCKHFTDVDADKGQRHLYTFPLTWRPSSLYLTGFMVVCIATVAINYSSSKHTHQKMYTQNVFSYSLAAKFDIPLRYRF